jgi:hypothetical protein
LAWGGGCGLDSTGSEQGPVAGCCECGDEPSGSCATELDRKFSASLVVLQGMLARVHLHIKLRSPLEIQHTVLCIRGQKFKPQTLLSASYTTVLLLWTYIVGSNMKL